MLKFEGKKSDFASCLSSICVMLLVTIVIDRFEVAYRFYIASYNVIPLLINMIIFSLLYYPVFTFFSWLYGDVKK